MTTHQNPKSDLVPRYSLEERLISFFHGYRYPGTVLRSYSYTHSLSSATWYLGPVPIPVPMVPIPMVPYPYPYPYLWSRTHTRTRTHDFVTCRTRTHTRTHGLVPVPVPIPMVSNPYPYPYPWPRTHTRTRTHDPYPHYKSGKLWVFSHANHICKWLGPTSNKKKNKTKQNKNNHCKFTWVICSIKRFQLQCKIKQ